MALPSSGPLSLQNIQTEFGGTNPISLNEYYAGGGLVPAGTSGTYGPVPSSGAISIRNFYGTQSFIPFGEAVYTSPGTYSFVVPAGITEISAVAVGGGSTGVVYRTTTGGGGALSYSNNIPVTPGESLTVVVGVKGMTVSITSSNTGVINPAGPSSISRGGTTLLLASAAAGTSNRPSNIAQGGQASAGIGAVRNSGGSSVTNSANAGAGGGGAAGYSGSGGNGNPALTPGGNGTGGGGGGGAGGNNTRGNSAGGGVGLYGQGANGVGGTTSNSTYTVQVGNPGSGGIRSASNNSGGSYGGGGGQDNDHPNYDYSEGGNGGVRIIWGTGKSYPFNAT